MKMYLSILQFCFVKMTEKTPYETTLKQTLLSLDTSHQGSPHKLPSPKYIMSGSGCRDRAELLPPAIYRAAVCASLFALENQQSIAIMITASHNPACDNGIKIGYSTQDVISKQVYQKIEECLNQRSKFQHFITSSLSKISNPPRTKRRTVFFIGCDTRSSSPYLVKIVQEVLHILSIKYINIGLCTTPELYSFSRHLITQNLQERIANTEDLKSCKQHFVAQVLQQFQSLYTLLHANSTNKYKILVDLSNGSGAISIIPYLGNLSKYFDIELVNNKNLTNPNYLCGADYICKNWLITAQQKYAIYDQLVFFDGDSDRIILKVGKHDQCFDGNYFLMLYIKTFVKIQNKLKENPHIGIQELQFNAISTFMMNLGVKEELSEIGVQYVVSDIGIQNIFTEALKTNKISIFFQPNGHGGVYFSEKSIKKIHEQLSKHPQSIQLKLLNTFYTILKNNSRGYGLHNMLMYFLCKQYLQLSNLQDLFHVTHEQSSSVIIKPEFDDCFLNGQQRDNQLIEPLNVIRIIDNIGQINKGYLITVRKSLTEKALVRLSVQGKNAKKCQQIVNNIKKSMEDFQYITKQNVITH